ncbi:multiubiquitin domain-containing protein [Mycolicibacterium peregrinum]|nr:multiubiquitin domain-containing protein [Mycolicibacterium peregrinum]
MTTPRTAHSAMPSQPDSPHRVKIVIFIDDAKFDVTEPELTGRQLKAVVGIAEANHLFLDVPGRGEDVQVFDDVPFKLKSGMKFYDVPVGNLGSR